MRRWCSWLFILSKNIITTNEPPEKTEGPKNCFFYKAPKWVFPMKNWVKISDFRSHTLKVISWSITWNIWTKIGPVGLYMILYKITTKKNREEYLFLLVFGPKKVPAGTRGHCLSRNWLSPRTQFVIHQPPLLWFGTAESSWTSKDRACVLPTIKPSNTFINPYNRRALCLFVCLSVYLWALSWLIVSRFLCGPDLYETVSSGTHWNHLMLPFLTHNNILSLILYVYTAHH